MARILGVDVPNEKPIVISLTYIYGIGRVTAQKVLKATKIDPTVRAKDLTEQQVARLYEYIDKNIVAEGSLKQKIFQDVKLLKDIRCYRGIRHKVGLPVRGQNTRRNARTRKGKAVAVGGLNRKLEKK